MNKLRDYQIDLSDKCAERLKSYGIVYLSAEVRTGKTLTALETMAKVNAKNVLILTKKKAIDSILNDYNNFGYADKFDLTVTNDESMHKVEGVFTHVIHDEHHRFGAFPKAGKYAKMFREKYCHLPMMFLSGTPCPESYSQIYHQFWVSMRNPFTETNFYKFANNYVTKRELKLAHGTVVDYSNCNYDKIDSIINKYMVTFTQKDAGFTTNVIEHILEVKMKESTMNVAKRLQNDLVVKGNTGDIVADTPAKLMQKLHQLYSGTIKLEDGTRVVIDTAKAEYIKQYFKDKKIGIFYKFIAELQCLKDVFGDELTTELDDFNTTNKNIALQIVSGREGISLKAADFLVFYNIDFSATSYWQARDRLTTMERKENHIYWVFSKGGIERKIHKAVMNKKNFTTSIFKREYGISTKSKEANGATRVFSN